MLKHGATDLNTIAPNNFAETSFKDLIFEFRMRQYCIIEKQ